MSMLLEISDLPKGEWFILGERSWRAGPFSSKNERQRRARRAGGFLAWRSFKLTEPYRGLWVEVIPYATTEDAEDGVRSQTASFEQNSRATVKVTEEYMVNGLEIAGAPAVWAYEKKTIGPRGVGIVRYLAWNVQHVEFIVCYSNDGDLWSWDEISTIARSQAEKIRKVLELS
jgi:hypothetical protein